MNRPGFPHHRPRRMRASAAMRALVREISASPNDLIWPIFVTDGPEAEPIAAMPGISRLPIKHCIQAAKEARALGIPAICLFPAVEGFAKTEDCAEAWNPENLSNRATRAIKDAVPEVLIMTDIALDPYNALGHDGIVRDGVILNDESVDALVRMALTQAQAGADILGPSDMMDGRVRAIRQALEDNGHHDTAIMSYSAKFASSFYGPFRDAVGASGRLSGDKATYQLDPGNPTEAVRMIERDLQEGADMVMVKPGMPYLDMCRMVKDRFDVPLFAYQVSGEYAMIRAAAAQGWIDLDKAVMESLISFKRAGCDGVLTYFAPLLARQLG